MGTSFIYHLLGLTLLTPGLVDYYISQAVDGLGSVSLSRSNSKNVNGRVYTGNDCEWIDLNKVGQKNLHSVFMK